MSELKKLERFVQKAKKTLITRLKTQFSEAKDSVGRSALFERLKKDVAFYSEDFLVSGNADADGSSDDRILEAAAKHWFIRFCQYRFLDVARFSPFNLVSPEKDVANDERNASESSDLSRVKRNRFPNSDDPEILQKALQGVFDSRLTSSSVQDEISYLVRRTEVKNIDRNAIYRALLLDFDRTVSRSFPEIFVATPELFKFFLPNDLLSDSAFVLRLINRELTDSLCRRLEVLGWLYQFWNADQKSKFFGRTVPTEAVPAATQLFTPDWVVKYLVQNSLGRRWLSIRPEAATRRKMEYCRFNGDDASDSPVEARAGDVSFSLNDEFSDDNDNRDSVPAAWTLLDPACGCGHILLEAYDFFRDVYLAENKPLAEIPKTILTRNLFGLDVDEPAVRLTRYSLFLKALNDDPSLKLENSPGTPISDLFDNFLAFGDLEKNGSLSLITRLQLKFGKSFISGSLEDLKNARTLGSLIRPLVFDSAATKTAFFKSIPDKSFRSILEILSRKFDFIICNPPYMGRKGMSRTLKIYADENYPDSKSDLYSAFIERSFDWVQKTGFVAMITMQSWLFLPSFQKLRKIVADKKTLVSVAHLGTGAFESINGEVVSVAAFIIKNQKATERPVLFQRLTEIDERKKETALKRGSYSFEIKDLGIFNQIPGSPWVYWLSPTDLDLLASGRKMGQVADVRQGLATADNRRFLRRWFEVDYDSIAFGCDSSRSARETGKKWFPYNKGGEQRKWFGNQDFVVNWQNDGQEIKSFRPRSFIRNESYYFRESISWSKVSNSRPTLRFYPQGHLFDVAGCSIFCGSRDELYLLAAYCNSPSIQNLLNAVSSTLNCEIGQIASFPLFASVFDENAGDEIRLISGNDVILANVRRLIELSRTDWDENELSWNFQTIPILSKSARRKALKDSFNVWRRQASKRIAETKRLEEENDLFFQSRRGLSPEAPPNVPVAEIRLFCNPRRRVSKSPLENRLENIASENDASFLKSTVKDFISFGIGCLFGRYSLDRPGTIFASRDYFGSCRFAPDANDLIQRDNILTFLENDPFPNNVVLRFKKFLTSVFDESSLQENVEFIENALETDLTSYFFKSFYNDHLAKFKKRPIYWSISSSDGSFNALVYYHRIDPNLLKTISENYFCPYRESILQNSFLATTSEIGATAGTENKKSKSLENRFAAERKRERKLAEFQRFADALRQTINADVAFDYDDGVQRGYLKWRLILKKIRGF